MARRLVWAGAIRSLLVFMLVASSRRQQQVFVRSMASSAISNTRQRRSKLVFHLFRHGDLRVHDNPALVYSSKNADFVIPIFCFDDKHFFGDHVKTPFGTLKCGPKRAKFITESVADLRQQLQGIGSSLVTTRGAPADVFDDILSKLKGASSSTMDISVVCQEEVVKEERDAVKSVQAILKKHCGGSTGGGKVEQIWGSTMYDLKDLPFDDADLQNMPDTFTPFRHKVEKTCNIGKPLPPPKKGSLSIPSSDTVEYKSIAELLSTPSLPSMKDLGYTNEQHDFANSFDSRGVMDFKGGETAALARVKDYIWDQDRLKEYFDTRNGMIGADYSTKFSPWLAHGCLSPRQVAFECKKYEEQRIANKSTYWVVFELLWRDFCKFFAYKHGDRIFFPGGTLGKDKKWSTFEKNFEAWKEGKTGYPLVDANMRELKASGFMSNRGRQNVASFLAIDLNHDWRFGGDWFESNLLDYDVYSNWVNWCAAAGMTGGRLNRFNIVKQSKDYDQHGEYVRRWLPELKNVPNEFVHEPWKMTQSQQREYGVKLGGDYPNPIVPPSRPNNNMSQNGRGGRGSGNKGKQGKQRKPNNSNKNKHQKYEMKSLKQGGYQIKG